MKVTVNGTTVEVPDGASVSVVNNEIIVNGCKVDSAVFSNELKIIVEGGLINLKTDRGSITVNGDVKGNVDAGGSATITGSVGGKVDASGSVSCGDVKGNVDASGSVKCGNVGGSVDASGNVMMGR